MLLLLLLLKCVCMRSCAFAARCYCCSGQNAWMPRRDVSLLLLQLKNYSCGEMPMPLVAEIACVPRSVLTFAVPKTPALFEVPRLQLYTRCRHHSTRHSSAVVAQMRGRMHAACRHCRS